MTKPPSAGYMNMKRILSFILSAAVCAGMLAGCTPQSEAKPEATPQPTQKVSKYRYVIEWKNENLKHMVCDLNGWPHDKDITPFDLRGIRDIYIMPDGTMKMYTAVSLETLPGKDGKFVYEGKEYTQRNKICLDDLVHFPELNRVNVIMADVESYDFLAEMKDLKGAVFHGCGIEDITPFAKAENLTMLSLSGNNITDISPVTQLKNLTWLELSFNNLSDISPLGEMEELPHDIVLSFNNISDISALAPKGRADNLAYLNLRNNKISDISALEGYKSIAILSLTNNYISDWNAIARLPSTDTVYTGGNPAANPQQTEERFPMVVIDLPIQWKDETLKKLVYSALGKDLSEDVYPQDLTDITQIIIIAGKELYFGEKTLSSGITGVADKNGSFKGKNKTYTSADMANMNLDDLHYFTNLTSIRISLVDSGDIEFVRHLPNLRQVFMNGCNISDISPLTAHKELLGANLSYNNISDLSPLSQVFIHSIYLDHNNISDLSVFAPMNRLPHEMNFAYNNISDITPLARGNRQEGLAHLSLRDNNISDISPLKDYVNISILSLTNNNITDVSPLKNLAKGNNIYLVNNPVANYEELAGFYNVSK